MKPPIGILEQIKRASSLKEALTLLTLGESYKWASDKTRRRWQRAFAKQLEA